MGWNGLSKQKHLQSAFARNMPLLFLAYITKNKAIHQPSQVNSLCQLGVSLSILGEHPRCCCGNFKDGLAYMGL